MCQFALLDRKIGFIIISSLTVIKMPSVVHADEPLMSTWGLGNHATVLPRNFGAKLMTIYSVILVLLLPLRPRVARICCFFLLAVAGVLILGLSLPLCFLHVSYLCF